MVNATCILRITKVTDISVEVPVLPAFNNAKSLAALLGAGVFGHPPEAEFWEKIGLLVQLIGLAIAEQEEFVLAQAPVGYDGELSVQGGVCMYQSLLNGIMRERGEAELKKRLAARG